MHKKTNKIVVAKYFYKKDEFDKEKDMLLEIEKIELYQVHLFIKDKVELKQ